MNQVYFQSEHLLFEPTTPDHDAVNIVFAFPNTYTVGITSLGYQGVWANLATRSQINVSRWFTDAHEDLPRKIEILGFSFSWELDYVNILAALKKFEIPIDTCDRTNEHPLVFGGGPVLTANPEPFAAWFDIVLLGDGEELIGNFLNAYQEV
ncbi:MAG: radical SAM protein, partial [Pseudanabaena sp. CAN_BIN31]|nr:radical SAM protein [Pseudanabaena sp. CAN_BIN31]